MHACTGPISAAKGITNPTATLTPIAVPVSDSGTGSKTKFLRAMPTGRKHMNARNRPTHMPGIENITLCDVEIVR